MITNWVAQNKQVSSLIIQEATNPKSRCQMGWFFSEGLRKKWPHAPLLTGVCWQCLVFLDFLDIAPISACFYRDSSLWVTVCPLLL